ncbi:putative protein-serine/threonine phosphatase [Helianthus annuus]|nr:putative protein-serine/threonine phosphatase [Helianthus annuus]
MSQFCHLKKKKKKKKVMSNQEAVDCIKNVKDARAAAKHLNEEALARKSTDDISCIVYSFEVCLKCAPNIIFFFVPGTGSSDKNSGAY